MPEIELPAELYKRALVKATAAGLSIEQYIAKVIAREIAENILQPNPPASDSYQGRKSSL